MLLSWLKSLKSIPTWKTTDKDGEEAEDWDTLGVLTPTAPFPPRIGRTTSRLLATWTSLIPTLKVRPLNQRAPLDSGTGLIYTLKWNPVCGLALPLFLEGKDWDKPIEDSCWACDRDQLIQPYRQASLGEVTSLRLLRKGNCEAQTSWHCLETELSTCAKIWAEFPTYLETALSKMVWTWEVINALHTQV